ncbi:MAG: tetraacyldisaccharide 4'-kinase [Prevotellaceae bacterium]|jgi:tetraacyldisaccharide 4'-kinase|nr:tetraacyldisaccharide 4'-kinase [Prevotellaceae bacterium]
MKYYLSQIFLFPLALLYGLAVGIRNWLFDVGILKSRKFKLPIIVVGNITVGGTGKTPHTEYLLSLLSPFMQVAMLSRGYKRYSKGLVFADENSNSIDIGDEPYQIKRKFPEVIVVVDANRCRAIDSLINSPNGEQLGAIILDDAFQYRYVEPGINILLTDYNNLITDDSLLPMGRLREPASNRKRAHIVIVTKCPDTAKPIDFRLITKKLALLPYQNLYFTRYEYGKLQAVFEEANDKYISLDKLTDKSYDILLLTGIVSSQALAAYVGNYTYNLQSIEYPDHHDFSEQDLIDIEIKFLSINNSNKIIVTTEKDAARLLSKPNISQALKESIFYIPVQVSFLFDKEKEFNEQILGYVRKNKTNRELFKS